MADKVLVRHHNGVAVYYPESIPDHIEKSLVEAKVYGDAKKDPIVWTLRLFSYARCEVAMIEVTMYVPSSQSTYTDYVVIIGAATFVHSVFDAMCTNVDQRFIPRVRPRQLSMF